MTPSPMSPDPLEAALRELEGLESVPLDGQPEVYDHVHHLITEALAGTVPTDPPETAVRP
jgi:hypothetical protein